jgi:hypothetical protein
MMIQDVPFTLWQRDADGNACGMKFKNNSGDQLKKI